MIMIPYNIINTSILQYNNFITSTSVKIDSEKLKNIIGILCQQYLVVVKTIVITSK